MAKKLILAVCATAVALAVVALIMTLAYLVFGDGASDEWVMFGLGLAQVLIVPSIVAASVSAVSVVAYVALGRRRGVETSHFAAQSRSMFVLYIVLLASVLATIWAGSGFR